MPEPRIVLLDEIGSTQDELLRRLRTGELIDAVAARTQSEGRGRFGRPWVSPPGESLSLSVAVESSRSGAPYVGMLLAARIAARYGIGVQWPNDVVADGRKIAGILVEVAEVSGRTILTVGVGINLGQREFPVSLADRATSLLLARGAAPEWETEARGVAALALQTPPQDWNDVAAEWTAVDTTEGKLYRPPGATPMRALGLDERGYLRLLTPEGERMVPAAEAYFGV